MREDGGFEVIKKVILNLSLRHFATLNTTVLTEKEMKDDWRRNMTVPTLTNFHGYRKHIIQSYLEDKCPTSNMDTYIVTGLLAETTILWEPTLKAEALATQKLALNV
ncbi:putative glutamine synthetase [Helianthus anomalus]